MITRKNPFFSDPNFFMSFPSTRIYYHFHPPVSKKCKTGDGLHFAYSDDGLNFKEIGRDKLFFKPKLGGMFRMTWTATTNGIGYARSRDLVN